MALSFSPYDAPAARGSMVAFPAATALTYVSATFWSVSRVHCALAFDAKAKPARAIVQNVMATLTVSLFVYASPIGFFAPMVCRFAYTEKEIDQAEIAVQ